jgi:hypothetical protein
VLLEEEELVPQPTRRNANERRMMEERRMGTMVARCKKRKYLSEIGIDKDKIMKDDPIWSIERGWYLCYNKQIMAILKPSAASLTLLLAVQLAVPTAFASGSCSVTVLDTVAGLGTEVALHGCTASANLALSMTPPSGDLYTQTVVTDSVGNATTLIPSKYTVTAGKYTLTIAGEQATFTVMADRPDEAHSTLLLSKQALQADGQDSLTTTAILRDRYDNPVSGRPLALMSGRMGDDITPQSKQTDEDGRFLWIVRSGNPGSMTLIPYDILSSKQMKLSAEVTVGNSSALLRGSLTNLPIGGSIADLTPALVDHFTLELPQGATEVKANELFTLTIKAMRGNEIVRGFVGTLVVSSTDPDADLPKKGSDPKSPTTGSIDMRAVDQGQRNVPLAFVFRQTGKQTVTVQDKNEPSITGDITINVTGGTSPDGGKIVILDPKDRSRIKGGSSILLQGKAPSLINLKVKGGAEEVSGDSDQEGVFRIDVPLNPADKEVTLFVQSENGTYESEPVHIIIDNDPPVIGVMSLDPVEGKNGEPSTLTVQSEAGLTSVVATLQGKTTTLAGSGDTYSAPITAPSEPGTYTITVSAVDSVGNTATKDMQWTVTSKEIPVVDGVKAESRTKEVFLTWKAISGFPISEYKIYIAKDSDPENYIYSVSTKKPVSSATIKDLPLGQTYQFSLTAMNAGGAESPEKSAPASATPLGMTLTAKPGKDSVLLEWTKMPTLPLDHYTLEYGVEEGQYSEKRTIDGASLSTVIHDLIGDVTYEFKLTPTTVTGKTMTELSVIARATVGSGPFTPSAADPVPQEIIGWTHSGANLLPPPATTIPEPPPEQFEDIPSNVSSGISSTVLWSVLLLGIGVTFLLWRKVAKEQYATKAFFDSMQQRYRS